ncbi:MAG: putative N-acetyltransferase, partial [Thermoleophilia bacterium]|nr:putative N-acetyltransferase [Thermoleophilia bacterium]
GAIYLDPAVVGQGVGAALWQGALTQLVATGHERVTVWVLDSNERGRAFYERMGLAHDGAEKADVVRGFPIREVRYCGSLQPG